MQQIKRTQHPATHLGSTAPFSLSVYIHELVCAYVRSAVCGTEDSLGSCLSYTTGVSAQELCLSGC